MAQIHIHFDQLVRLQFEQSQRQSYPPNHPVSGLLSGRYGSRLRGRGLSFEELRDYRVGDD
ncbi:MAG: DUF58 domain-containing protein, partial [Pirellulales bacterium]|nr:DUF58 domain-containing protein [Pirellulales bacterium]